MRAIEVIGFTMLYGSIVLAASLLLAEAGEPSSVWLWRDVLGVTL